MSEKSRLIISQGLTDWLHDLCLLESFAYVQVLGCESKQVVVDGGCLQWLYELFAGWHSPGWLSLSRSLVCSQI